MPLVLRQSKGSPLTTAEMDANLTLLNNRARPYATVAAMQADTALAVGEYVSTLGYYAPGDGGAATYEIVSSTASVGYDEPNASATNWTDSGLRQDISGAYWIKIGVTATLNTLTAPDGTLTADFLQENSGTMAHMAQCNGGSIGFNSPAVSRPGPQEAFCYVAKYDPASPNNSRQHFVLTIACGGLGTTYSGAVVVDIHKDAGVVTKEIYGPNLTYASTVVNSVGNYWLVRLRYTPTVPGTTASGKYLLCVGASNSATPAWATDTLFGFGYTGQVYSVNYTGDGASGVYVWGWGVRPVVSPSTRLLNTLQASPLGKTIRVSQFGASSSDSTTALQSALATFGTSVSGTLVVDIPISLGTSSFVIPSNVDLKFEGAGAITAVSGLTVNSQLTADNRAILPKYATVTLGPRQQSVKSNWFAL